MSALHTAKKALAAFNRHDAEAFAALYAEDAVAPDPQYADPLQGREAIRKDIADFFLAFPDVRARSANFLVDGDTVAFEVEITGTHNGPLVTPEGPVPATGKQVKMTGGRFVQVNSRGQIVSCRRYYDLAGLVQQLGLFS
ncbi:MAG TPA: ester cyclase [Dehalococcoidia bacterium]|nr:ester cyclase [Dehalococcoidia bacterium]